MNTKIDDEKSKYYRPWENLTEINSKGMEVLRLPEKTVNSLIKKHYGVFGHSAVQICSWTKKAMSNRGVCYKEKFYGIDCANCMEFSPAAMWCQQNCTYCWRPMEFMKNVKIDPNKVDEPKEIISELVEKRKKLLGGMGGHPNVDRKIFDEGFFKMPTHFAISLSGEPTLYPKLPEMVKYLKSLPRTKSIFIVTNGQETDFFKKLAENEEFQPTQLYVSIDAPNEELFDKINLSLHKNGFNILKNSLKIFSSLSCRRILRYTMIKGLNSLDEHIEGYKELINIANPDFVEIKSYMHLGMSQNRHTKDQMPEFIEVEEFAKKLAESLGNYSYLSSAPNSKIVVIRRDDSKFDISIEKFEN